MILNWILDKTVGAWQEILADKPILNKWGQALIDEQREEDIERASGVGVGGKTVVASKPVVAQRVVAAKAEVDSYLLSQGQHWTQAEYAGVADKLRSALVLVAALGLGAYLLVEIGKAYVSRRR